MKYIVKLCSGKHLALEKCQYQIPSETDPTDCNSEFGFWLIEKPTKGVDINAAYRRLEFLSNFHSKCCIFEVVEV